MAGVTGNQKNMYFQNHKTTSFFFFSILATIDKELLFQHSLIKY